MHLARVEDVETHRTHAGHAHDLRGFAIGGRLDPPSGDQLTRGLARVMAGTQLAAESFGQHHVFGDANLIEATETGALSYGKAVRCAESLKAAFAVGFKERAMRDISASVSALPEPPRRCSQAWKQVATPLVASPFCQPVSWRRQVLASSPAKATMANRSATRRTSPDAFSGTCVARKRSDASRSCAVSLELSSRVRYSIHSGHAEP